MAPSWEATDWPAIVALYDRLVERWPSPSARIARALAIGYGPDGPAAGLATLEDVLDPRQAPGPASTWSPGRTCCDASAGPRRPGWHISRRGPWSATRSSRGSSTSASRSSATRPTARTDAGGRSIVGRDGPDPDSRVALPGSSAWRCCHSPSPGLVVGLLAAWAGNDDLAWWAWTVPAVIVGVRLAWTIVRDLLDREAGVDVIALLAIAGALAVDESFAGAMIAVMLATGGRSRTTPPGGPARADRLARAGARQQVDALRRAGRSRSCRWPRSSWATACWCDRARSSRWTGGRCPAPPPGRVGAHRASRCRSSVPPATPSAAAWSTPAAADRPDRDGDGRSRTYAGIVRLVEQAQASQGAVRPRSPTGTPCSSCPLTLVLAGVAWAAQRGPRPRRSPCSSWRRRVRCSWPPRSRSCPASPAPRTAGHHRQGRWRRSRRLAGARVHAVRQDRHPHRGPAAARRPCEATDGDAGRGAAAGRRPSSRRRRTSWPAAS